MSNFLSFKGDKLVDISNYIEQKTNTNLFLEINGYILYINSTKESPSKSLYYKIETSTNKEGKETRSYSNALSLKLDARYSNKISTTAEAHLYLTIAPTYHSGSAPLSHCHVVIATTREPRIDCYPFEYLDQANR